MTGTTMAQQPVPGVIYSVDNFFDTPESNFITIDPSSGNGMEIGSAGFQASAAAFSPDGRLYTIINPLDGSPQMGIVDIGTGQVTPLGPPIPVQSNTYLVALEITPDGSTAVAGAFDGSFYHIDPATGVSMMVSPPGSSVPMVMDYAFDSFGRLWAVARDWSAGQDRLYELDPATGFIRQSIVLSGIFDCMGIMFDENDTLFATNWVSAFPWSTVSANLYTINIATGEATIVGSTGLKGVHGGDIYTGRTNSAPIASAGPDQLITLIGTTVQLNGSQSYDPDGDPISYQWIFTSIPAGSNAVLSGANTATPTFVADVHGSYIAQLVVSDPWIPSAPATVVVSFNNIKPTANAGTSQSVVVGNTVTLNGSGSSDANSDPLTFSWQFVSVPAGSQSALADPSSAITAFVPDLPGTYVVQLIVNDGFADSDPSFVQIQAISLQTAAIQALENLQAQVALLDPSVFKNTNMRNALLNKVNAVISNVESGDYASALNQLQSDILGKTDGCANSGGPDKNDWIKDCGSQELVYPYVVDAIAEVQALL